jgi:hypothetical protein
VREHHPASRDIARQVAALSAQCEVTKDSSALTPSALSTPASPPTAPGHVPLGVVPPPLVPDGAGAGAAGAAASEAVHGAPCVALQGLLKARTFCEQQLA